MITDHSGGAGAGAGAVADFFRSVLGIIVAVLGAIVLMVIVITILCCCGCLSCVCLRQKFNKR